LGLDKSDQIFLVPGGDQAIKGSVVAIKAFFSIKRDDTALVVLGMSKKEMTGGKRFLYYFVFRPLGILNHKEELLRYIRKTQHPKVRYCASVKEVKPYIEASIAVISPFVVPHAAKAALEAGLSKRISIVSDNGEGREYVLHGETGWVFPAGDVSALALAMQQVLDDPVGRKQMGENAKRYISRCFNKSDSMSSVCSVIEELLKNSIDKN